MTSVELASGGSFVVPVDMAGTVGELRMLLSDNLGWGMHDVELSAFGSEVTDDDLPLVALSDGSAITRIGCANRALGESLVTSTGSDPQPLGVPASAPAPAPAPAPIVRCKIRPEILQIPEVRRTAPRQLEAAVEANPDTTTTLMGATTVTLSAGIHEGGAAMEGVPADLTSAVADAFMLPLTEGSLEWLACNPSAHFAVSVAAGGTTGINFARDNMIELWKVMLTDGVESSETVPELLACRGFWHEREAMARLVTSVNQCAKGIVGSGLSALGAVDLARRCLAVGLRPTVHGPASCFHSGPAASSAAVKRIVDAGLTLEQYPTWFPLTALAPSPCRILWAEQAMPAAAEVAVAASSGPDGGNGAATAAAGAAASAAVRAATDGGVGGLSSHAVLPADVFPGQRESNAGERPIEIGESRRGELDAIHRSIASRAESSGGGGGGGGGSSRAPRKDIPADAAVAAAVTVAPGGDAAFGVVARPPAPAGGAAARSAASAAGAAVANSLPLEPESIECKWDLEIPDSGRDGTMVASAVKDAIELALLQPDAADGQKVPFSLLQRGLLGNTRADLLSAWLQYRRGRRAEEGGWGCVMHAGTLRQATVVAERLRAAGLEADVRVETDRIASVAGNKAAAGLAEMPLRAVDAMDVLFLKHLRFYRRVWRQARASSGSAAARRASVGEEEEEEEEEDGVSLPPRIWSLLTRDAGTAKRFKKLIDPTSFKSFCSELYKLQRAPVDRVKPVAQQALAACKQWKWGEEAKRAVPEGQDTDIFTMETYAEGDLVILLPCQHTFENRAIRQWLSTNTTCPVCKASLPEGEHRFKQAVGIVQSCFIHADADPRTGLPRGALPLRRTASFGLSDGPATRHAAAAAASNVPAAMRTFNNHLRAVAAALINPAEQRLEYCRTTIAPLMTVSGWTTLPAIHFIASAAPGGVTAGNLPHLRAVLEAGGDGVDPNSEVFVRRLYELVADNVLAADDSTRLSHDDALKKLGFAPHGLWRPFSIPTELQRIVADPPCGVIAETDGMGLDGGMADQYVRKHHPEGRDDRLRQLRGMEQDTRALAAIILVQNHLLWQTTGKRIVQKFIEREFHVGRAMDSLWAGNRDELVVTAGMDTSSGYHLGNVLVTLRVLELVNGGRVGIEHVRPVVTDVSVDRLKFWHRHLVGAAFALSQLDLDTKRALLDRDAQPAPLAASDEAAAAPAPAPAVVESCTVPVAGSTRPTLGVHASSSASDDSTLSRMFEHESSPQALSALFSAASASLSTEAGASLHRSRTAAGSAGTAGAAPAPPKLNGDCLEASPPLEASHPSIKLLARMLVNVDGNVASIHGCIARLAAGERCMLTTLRSATAEGLSYARRLLEFVRRIEGCEALATAVYELGRREGYAGQHAVLEHFEWVCSRVLSVAHEKRDLGISQPKIRARLRVDDPLWMAVWRAIGYVESEKDGQPVLHMTDEGLRRRSVVALYLTADCLSHDPMVAVKPWVLP